MRKDEYEERVKPMLWAMFATGVLAARMDNMHAIAAADKMLPEFEKRFVKADEPDKE